VAVTTVVFPTVIPTVTVAIRPVVTPVIPTPTIAIASFVRNSLLKAVDSIVDRIRLVWVQAVAGHVSKLALDIARLIAKAIGFAFAQDIALVETADLPLNPVDMRLQAADMPVIVVAIGITVRRLLTRIVLAWVVLSRSRRGECESRGGCSNREKNFTHCGSPTER
jgi:hypothetical protein